MTTNQVNAFCRELCDRLADLGREMRWEQRIAAAILVITRVTGAEPEVLPVRAVVYSRSAVFRLGGALMPTHQGEVDHFREQVGPAMVLLGVEHPHAVLVVGGVMIELADAVQWNDRGVLLRPFVDDRPASRFWTVEGLRYGVSVTYEQWDGNLPLRIAPDLVAHDLARKVEAAMHAPQDRAVG